MHSRSPLVCALSLKNSQALNLIISCLLAIRPAQLGSVLALLEQRSRAHYQPPPHWLLHAATAPPAWDAPADNTAYVALNCLTQLLAWLPLQLLAAEDCRVVDVVFTFAALVSILQ